MILPWSLLAAQTFTVGTYNVEMYITHGFKGTKSKSESGKSKVQEQILALQADVLALEEIGTTNLLVELRDSLDKLGLNYPYWEFVEGSDTNLHLALLSRFPIVARRPHTKEVFLLNGRRLSVNRGFLEVDVQVNEHYRFTLLSAHLKSKRQSFIADEEEIRESEAGLLRKKVDQLLSVNVGRNVVVLGDFNDNKSSPTLKTLMGKGALGLVDTRPTERPENGNHRERNQRESWTFFFATEDVYSRVDYILISRGMAREWVSEESFVLARPDWSEASDHRPIVTQFHAKDR